jgi:hypothetical protein
MAGYQEGRDGRVRGLLDITDRIASFDWGLDQVKAYHRALNKAMIAQLEAQHALR